MTYELVRVASAFTGIVPGGMLFLTAGEPLESQSRWPSTALAVAMSVTRSVTHLPRRIAVRAGTFSDPKALTMTWVIDGIRSSGTAINP